MLKLNDMAKSVPMRPGVSILDWSEVILTSDPGPWPYRWCENNLEDGTWCYLYGYRIRFKNQCDLVWFVLAADGVCEILNVCTTPRPLGITPVG